MVFFHLGGLYMRIISSKYPFVFSLVVLIICCITLSSCGHKNEDLKGFTAKYASEYTVVNKEKDNYSICVSAPDFQKIATLIMEEGNDNKVDSKKIIDYAEQHPEYEKEYILNVDGCSEDVIHKKLLDQISYDLMVAAIQNNEYSERWDTE